MLKKKTFVFLIFFLTALFLAGQCPDRKFLGDRIAYLRDNNIDKDVQLTELLIAKSKMDSCHFQYDSVYFLLLQRIGVMYYLKADYIQAEDITKKAISLIYSSGTAKSSNRLFECYHNLKFYYDAHHSVLKRNEMIDSCVSIAIKANAVNENILQLMIVKISYLLNIGDYHECISYANLGERLAKKQGLETTQANKELFSWKVNAFLLLYQYDSANIIIKQKINDYRASNENKYLGNLYSLYAKCFSAKDKTDSALYYLQQSFSFCKKQKQKDGCASALNDMGFLCFDKIHDYDKSLMYCRMAMKYSNPVESISILDNIANAFLKKKVYDSAFFYFQQAFDQIQPGVNEIALLTMSEDFFNTNHTEYLITLILDKADAFFEKYKNSGNIKDQATTINIYKTADLLLNKIKLEQTEPKSKLFWRKNSRRLYEHAIAACLMGNDTENGFYFFERSRAVLLNDQLKEQRWLNNDQIVQLAALNKKKSDLENAPASQTALANTGHAESELIKLNQELARLNETVRRNNPLYYHSFIDTGFQTIKDFQKLISGSQQSLIELFEGDSAVFILLVTPVYSTIGKVDKNRFSALSGEFLKYLSDEILLNKDYYGFIKTSFELYQLLFKENPLPVGRIIISPDGPSFPFEALVTAIHGNEPEYLLTAHPVSYTYSARYLESDFSASEAEYTGDFLGIAPIEYKSNLGMAALTGSDESLNRINGLFNRYQSQAASAATRNNFMQQFPGYKIIQLYTHASANNKQGDPLIYFSDSVLYLSGLQPGRKPVSKLVVLSACETANGKLYPGEGVFSFNRGFAALGIPTCVSNLWSVNNMATYQLTELFYQQLAKGLPLDIALQKAKLEFFNKSAANHLPYYWAAVILVGKTNAIPASPSSSSYYIYIAIAAIALLLLLLLGRQLKKGKQVSYS